MVTMGMGHFYAILGAAFAIIFAGIGSAIGVGRAAQASAALVSKQPDKFSKTIVLQVMPSTQGLYGFVVAFIVLIQTGAIGGLKAVTPEMGLTILAYSLPIALAGMISAIMQGNVAVSCVGLIGKHEEESSHAIIMLIFVELFALFAFLISFLGIMLLDIPAIA
ncbi:MAG: V-type ATP synthase subunit K [Clostridiales bacterium]|nr:V-type ATP synthase subunit K [Clostridiales bacterium]